MKDIKRSTRITHRFSFSYYSIIFCSFFFFFAVTTFHSVLCWENSKNEVVAASMGENLCWRRCAGKAVVAVPTTTFSLGWSQSQQRPPELSHFYIRNYSLLQQNKTGKISKGRGSWGRVQRKPGVRFYAPSQRSRRSLIPPAMMCGNKCKGLPTREVPLSLVFQNLLGSVTPLTIRESYSACVTDFSYWGPRPPDWKQVFTINNIISINYLDKLVQYVTRPQAYTNNLMKQNILKAQL